MPVVAIVAAGAAWMGAAGAIGAGITAAAAGAGIMGTMAAVGLTGMLSITAAVGATLGAVGAITHDKGLTMAGTIIGGVGAIGSLANAAGMFGDTSQLFGSANVAVNVGDLPAPPSDFIESLNKSVTDIIDQPVAIDQLGQVTNQAVGDVVNTVPGAATVAAPPSAAEAATAPSVAAPSLDTAAQQEMRVATAGLGDTGTDTTNLMSVVGKTTPAGDPILGATAPTLPSTPQPEALARVANLETAKQAAASTIEAPEVAKPSFFDKFLSFADKHDMATYGMIQAASQLIGGMLDPTVEPKIAAMDAQAQVNRATAAEQERQTANASGPIPAAHLRPRLAPVTGSPSVTPQAVTGKPYVYPGLINSSAVTGAPA